jgi:large subunit ribosomal protein L22
MVMPQIKKQREVNSMTDVSTNSKEDKLEATAKVRMLKTSPQKLNLVSRMIRNKPVNIALAQLKFSKKRIAKDVRKCLESAVANAENNHDLDIDELVVSEAYVGKNLVLKRGRPRARGRYGKILKPFSQLTIKVKQILANSEEKEKA